MFAWTVNSVKFGIWIFGFLKFELKNFGGKFKI